MLSSYDLGLTIYGNLDDPTFSFFVASTKDAIVDTLHYKKCFKSAQMANGKDSCIIQKSILSKSKSDSIRQFVTRIILTPIGADTLLNPNKDGTKLRFFYNCGNEMMTHSFFWTHDIKVKTSLDSLFHLLNYKLE